MTFVVAPQPFNTASGAQNASRSIEDWKDGLKIPAAILSPVAGSDIDTLKLAGNLADFMNGINPRARHGEYDGAGSRTLHYTLLPTGIAFSYHYRDADGNSLGTSRDAATLIVMPDYRAHLADQLAQRGEIFKFVMDNANHPERRDHLREPGEGKAAPHAAARPAPAM